MLSVFISHSSHDDASKATRAALKAAGMGVLVDCREIRLGDEWRRKVSTWSSIATQQWC